MTMKDIRQTVGYNSINNYQDVLTVQTLLVQQGAKDLRVDGLYGPKTLKAITEFQGRFLRSPDGVVSPNKKTIQFLNASPGTIPSPSQPQQLPLKKTGSAYDNTRNHVYPPTTVTIEILDTVNPEGKGAQNIEVLPYINEYLQIYEVSNPQEIAHLLAQMAHESHLKPKAEDTAYRYTSAKKNWSEKKYGNLSKVCTSPLGPRGKKVYQDNKLVLWCNGKDLLNIVYGIKHEGLGNDKPGDGYLYRGRGLIQTTGKANYQAFEDDYNTRFPQDEQHFVENPDLLSTSIKYATASSLFFWTHNHVGQKARAKYATVHDVTVPINYQLKGLQDRIKRFNRVAPLLGVQQVNE